MTGRASETGSGTLAILVCVVLAMVMAATVVGIGGLRAARVQVQAAADLAALAGGDISAAGAWADITAEACAAAEQVAVANDTTVTQCWTRGVDVYVTVERQVSAPSVGEAGGPALVKGTIRTQARAGPSER